MIAPHELKNKVFSRAVRGYNQQEVDEYFDFLIEKYTEAYKAASELEQKFNKLQAKYSELSNEEESIRSAILKAQKLGEAIVQNAQDEAKSKEDDLQERCDQIVAEAKERVEIEKENILRLRRTAIEFQHKLYDDYVKHVEMIRSMNLDEMPIADTIFNEDASLAIAKAEALDGKDFSILVPGEAIADNSEESKDN